MNVDYSTNLKDGRRTILIVASVVTFSVSFPEIADNQVAGVLRDLANAIEADHD